MTDRHPPVRYTADVPPRCSGTPANRPIRPALARWVTAAAIATLLAPATELAIHAQSRTLSWKATSSSGSVVYLVGSVHLLNKDYYPLSPAIEQAFAETDLLVEELHLGELRAPESQLALLRAGQLGNGQTLDAVISPRTFDLVRARVAALGLPLEPLKRFKPWSIALMLMGLEWQKAGFDADFGLDTHFYDRAVTAGKAIQGLETVAYQIARFDELSMADQDRLLTVTLKELDVEKMAVRTIADAWRAGDITAIERIVLSELKADALMYERLLVERNAAWLPKIVELFARAKPSFVVVGAAHLVGPDGLIAQLSARGYRLQQL